MTEDDTFRVLTRAPVAEVRRIFERFAKDEIPTHACTVAALKNIGWEYSEAVNAVFENYYDDFDKTQLKSS